MFGHFADQMAQLNEELRRQLFQSRHVPDMLFHYTDVYGLKGILESKKWRATHYRYMNDGKEIIYGDELVSTVLEEHRSKMHDEVLTRIYHSVLSKDHGAPSVMRAWDYDIYLTSFSENGDFLDQWRAYGSDGYGYSIGIDPHRLKFKIEEPVILTSRDQELAFIQVIYDEEQQRALTSELINKAEEIILSEYAARQVTEIGGFFGEAIWSLSTQLWQLSLLFKHPAFCNEKEWRVIKTRFGRNVSLDTKRTAMKEVLLRASNHKLIPYLELDFSLYSNDQLMPIRQIVLGPKHRLSNASESLDMFLISLGYFDRGEAPPRITVSELPYQ